MGAGFREAVALLSVPVCSRDELWLWVSALGGWAPGLPASPLAWCERVHPAAPLLEPWGWGEPGCKNSLAAVSSVVTVTGHAGHSSAPSTVSAL